MTVLDGPAAIEAVAQAIYINPDATGQQSWADLPERYKLYWRAKAARALIALGLAFTPVQP